MWHAVSLERRGQAVTGQLGNARPRRPRGRPADHPVRRCGPRRRGRGVRRGRRRRRRQPQRAARGGAGHPARARARARPGSTAPPARSSRRRPRTGLAVGATRRPGHGHRGLAALADRGRGPDRRRATTPGCCCATPARGTWTAETKVSIDLGTDTVRNFQQAGLVAYVDDDLFTRLSHVAIWNTRQTEFGKEMPYAGRLSYGGTIVGPPAATTWLRLTHRLRRRTGEHLLRAWTQPRRPHLGQGRRLDPAGRRARSGSGWSRTAVPARPPTSTTCASTAADATTSPNQPVRGRHDHDRHQRPGRTLPPSAPGDRRCGGCRSPACRLRRRQVRAGGRRRQPAVRDVHRWLRRTRRDACPTGTDSPVATGRS